MSCVGGKSFGLSEDDGTMEEVVWRRSSTRSLPPAEREDEDDAEECEERLVLFLVLWSFSRAAVVHAGTGLMRSNLRRYQDSPVLTFEIDK